MDRPVTIALLHNDLRLDDHPALVASAAADTAVVPVFVWDPASYGGWPPGAASRWWLHHSLASVRDALEGLGSRLILRSGPIVREMSRLVAETGAARVLWTRRFEPAWVTTDAELELQLRKLGVRVERLRGALLAEPHEVRTGQGGAYRVFTPFSRACATAIPPDAPLPAPKRLCAPSEWPHSLDLEELRLLPSVDWAHGLRAAWSPGEAGARRALADFLAAPVVAYDTHRDRCDLPGTSRLSAHLHFGEISVRKLWTELRDFAAATRDRSARESVEAFQRQILWREFAHHLLFHFPQTDRSPLRDEFERFPWIEDAEGLGRWQRGHTGYPIVDAGMRELWETGWMHNRVRMVVASFLVKDQMIDWRHGARWFWDTLVDADLANNTLGWQWTAGCGADAAPYFRIFNPVRQGRRFDPDGAYVARWVPELSALPPRWIHEPWAAPPEVLDTAGVRLGQSYPSPIVEHAGARARALAAYKKLRR